MDTLGIGNYTEYISDYFTEYFSEYYNEYITYFFGISVGIVYILSNIYYILSFYEYEKLENPKGHKTKEGYNPKGYKKIVEHNNDLEDKIDELQNQIDNLYESIENLAKVLDKLIDKVDYIDSVLYDIEETNKQTEQKETEQKKELDIRDNIDYKINAITKELDILKNAIFLPDDE
jgi:hypothetical protein